MGKKRKKEKNGGSRARKRGEGLKFSTTESDTSEGTPVAKSHSEPAILTLRLAASVV